MRWALVVFLEGGCGCPQSGPVGNLHVVWFPGRWQLSLGAFLSRMPCIGTHFDEVPICGGCQSRLCGIGSPGLSYAVCFFCPGAAVLFGGCSAYCHHRFWQVVGLRADSSVYDPDLVCLASPLVSGLVESSPAPRLLKPSLFAFIGVGARFLVRLVFLCFC